MNTIKTNYGDGMDCWDTNHSLMEMTRLRAVATDGKFYKAGSIPKRFKGKALFIYIFNEKENPDEPHFHFSPYSFEDINDLKDMYDGKNMNPDTIKHSERGKFNWLQGCIRLDKVDYNEHGNWHRTLNTENERDSMASFLKSDSDRFDKKRGRLLTWWEALVSEWNDGKGNEKNKVKVRYDKQGKAIQPDYSKLEVVPFKLK